MRGNREQWERPSELVMGWVPSAMSTTNSFPLPLHQHQQSPFPEGQGSPGVSPLPPGASTLPTCRKTLMKSRQSRGSSCR